MTINTQPSRNQGQTGVWNSYPELKRSLINPALWLLSIFGITAALATLPSNVQTGSWVASLLLVILAGGLLIITFLKAISISLKSVSLLIIFYLYGLYALILKTPLLDGRIILGCFIVTTFILFSSRTGIIAAVISTATVLLSGGINLALESSNFSATLAGDFSDYISTSTVFTLAALFLAIIMTLFVRRVQAAFSARESRLEELTNETNLLDSSFQNATEEYKKNQRSFEITNQFIEQFSINSPPESVLSRAVEYIRSEFDFYFVAVFVPDEKNEFAVLKAGTGTEGNNLLSLGYQVKLSDIGLISHSFNYSEMHLSTNVHEDIEYQANPHLPETNSELTIPLIVNEIVIGILDIESAKVNKFSPEDLKILRIFANQLALIYDKSQLAQKLSFLEDEIENTYKQFTQKSWKSFIRTSKKKYSYRYADNNLEKEALQPVEVLQAINQGEAVVMPGQTIPGSGKKSTSLAIPIKLRGQTIGALDIKLNLEKVPGDLTILIESISERLAIALENARLLEEIQEKADREHRVGEISSKIRSSPNVEQILRTAVAEIGQSLGASEVFIQLRSEQ